jgi:hypothetical protein
VYFLKHVLALCLLIGLFVVAYSYMQNREIQTLVISGESEMSNVVQAEDGVTSINTMENIQTIESVRWPVPGSAPTANVQHIIPLEEVKQGCVRQDCIPSVDDANFVSPADLDGILDSQSIGIALSYKGEERFYPFPMLETHELVNDVVAGDPILISYCPLCGTGIVFNRTLDGKAVEFGVSGMLWQSNLLMYNRADSLENRNLWSQVLGQAVIGDRAGQKLGNIASDIMRFVDWKESHPDGLVLSTGSPTDPYGGNYYGVAQRFGPNFDPQTSVLVPDTYVYGIDYADTFKAYPRDSIPEGEIRDMIGGEEITITNTAGTVVFTDAQGTVVSDVEGFWFSWIAAHPQTEIYSK